MLVQRRVTYAARRLTPEQILALRPGDLIAMKAIAYGPHREVPCNQCAGLGLRPPIKEQPSP